MLWSLSDKWSMGARYDTAFTGRALYRETETGWQDALRNVFWSGNLTGWSIPKREKRQLRFPATLALGNAFRVNDRLTLSMDVTRTDWNDFYFTDALKRHFSLVDGQDRTIPWARTDFKPTTTVRFGAEHVFSPKNPDEVLKNLWTLRGGLFYDEEPASHRSTAFKVINKGTGEPNSFHGFVLGCGLLTRQRVNIDFAYQLRYGKGVNGDMISVNGFKEDLVQHRFLLSTVIYF